MGDAREICREAFRHLAEDRVEEALAGYRRALEVDPELPLAWQGLSTVHKRMGDLDAAIAAAEKLVELEPDDPLSHTNLSILYQNKGLIPEAEEAKAAAMQAELRQGKGASGG